MNIKTFIQKIREEVKGYQVPVVDLIAVQTKDPFKILVATILSARTKDETTAKAAHRLFQVAPTLVELSCLPIEKISKLIYPVGFYKSKAGYLHNLQKALEQFDGKIPEDIDSLIKLPGVGRKTANLVRSVAFHKDAICVDTHVHRICNIWGYVRTKNPLETEMALRAKLPREFWQEINTLLVTFGQGTCRPVAPHCDICVINDICPKRGIIPRKIKASPNNKKSSDGDKRFISWNVNGIRALEKKGLVQIIRDLAPDILALQETKAQPEQLSDDLLNIKGYNAYWHSAVKKGYSGVVIYSREKPLKIIYGLGLDDFDQEGRVLTLEFNDFYFITAYFPNAQHKLLRIDYKLAFNKAIHAFANQLVKKKSLLLCGDLNVAHTAIDLTNPASNESNPGYSLPERQWMDSFTEAGYIDTFRQFNKEPNNYSWWSYRFNARERNIGWRIDYFIVDEKSAQRVKSAAILPEVMGSDHCPVSITFS